jgi:colanic acid biosynthesis glycosyl transferase WcaI
MRVLLYGINYAPELTGCGKYTGEMAEWLAARGAHVTVVTAPPYYPAWRVDAPHAWHLYRAETKDRIEVVRCPLFVPKRASGLKRVLHLLSFACTSLPVLLWLALRRRPDVIVAIEPPFLGAPAAWLAAKLTGAASWLHVQDFEIDTAFDLGLLRSKRLRQVVLRAERALMRRFDRVTTISERMRSRLRAKGVASERAQLFPNWVDLQRIRPLPQRPRSARFRADDIVVLYSGNMGRKQGLETLLEAARLVAAAGESRVRFLICGDGVERAELGAAAKGLTNVSFAPLVPLDRLNSLLNLADIHVLPQRADAEDLVFPSKLTNMLASGRPVVSTARAGTQIASVLDGCGVVVPPGDAAALARALCELAADELQRRVLGAEARRVAERLWDKNTVLANAFGPYLEPATLAAAEAHRSPAPARPKPVAATSRALRIVPSSDGARGLASVRGDTEPPVPSANGNFL